MDEIAGLCILLQVALIQTFKYIHQCVLLYNYANHKGESHREIVTICVWPMHYEGVKRLHNSQGQVYLQVGRLWHLRM